jgi:imidazole glycerol-phosphate synthase subunit HisH
MITIIDYNLGNVGSIKNMIEFLGYSDVEISSNHERILSSSHLILPGVGSFDQGMLNLNSLGLDLIIKKYALNLKKPLLGICLGLQLLGHSSEEGIKPGLSLIDFHNIKFKVQQPLKIPHMGWNTVMVKKHDSPLVQGIDQDYRFYFVHSYHAVPVNPNNIVLTTDYGYETCVAIQEGQIYGVQFHPEKSHKFGMKLLKNFLGPTNV